MKQIDWGLLLKDYKGKWVALTEDKKKVLASGINAKSVYQEASDKGEKIPTLVKVPKTSVLFVG